MLKIESILSTSNMNLFNSKTKNENNKKKNSDNKTNDQGLTFKEILSSNLK